MNRLAVIVASTLIFIATFSLPANASPIVLDPGPGTDYLGVWCGGQGVNEIATGFDAAANAVTLVKVTTTCHGSGRGSPNQYYLACWTVTFGQNGGIVSKLSLGTFHWSQGHAAIPCPVSADSAAVYTYTDGAGNFPDTLSTAVIGSSGSAYRAVLEETCATIAYGDVVAGTISAQGQACYTFTGAVTNAVEVSVVKTSGTLLPIQEIRRPDGSVLCNTVSGVVDCTLDVSGLHTIVVGDSSGSGTGDFTLALNRTDVPHLTIRMSATLTSSAEHRKLVYMITVGNDGGAAATDVVLTDTLPNGLLIRNLSSSQGSCAQAGKAVTCMLGSLGAAQTVRVKIATVTGLKAGQVTNTACVDTNTCVTRVTNLP